MNPAIVILALVALLDTTGCHTPAPSPDCMIEQEDGDDATELPDLPCGGADLMTDNLNCGTCGHECLLWDPGTDYEAGTCSAGVCGPGWSDCLSDLYALNTCAEICAAFEVACVPKGCSGYTGLLYQVLFGEGCDPYVEPPVATMTGSCNEPIPWMTPSDYPLHTMCCCDFQ